MESNQGKVSKMDSFNYLPLLKSLFEKKEVIILFSLIGLAIGLLIAFTSPKEYNSSSYILLESGGSNNSLGRIGSLAGLAGISMPEFQSGQMALTSEIFPEVIYSRDFLIDISKQKFEFKTKESKLISLEDYYSEENLENIVTRLLSYIRNIPSIILEALSKDDILTTEFNKDLQIDSDYVILSGKELFAASVLKKKIIIEQNGKLVRLSVLMPEPLISAKVNIIILNKLIDYVTEYKIGGLRRNLEFVQERMSEAEKRFSTSQLRLAQFKDSNQVLSTQTSKTKEEQLQIEYNIALNLLNSLKIELEKAEIQLKKETPIFTVLEKANVPLGVSKPNKSLIIIFSLFIGLLSGFVFNLLKFLISNLQINKS